MICNTCRYYEFSTERCSEFNQMIGKDIQIVSCNRYDQTSIKQGDIFWGKDENTTEQWWLCHKCHAWFKESDKHYCSGTYVEDVIDHNSEDFITEGEMEI